MTLLEYLRIALEKEDEDIEIGFVGEDESLLDLLEGRYLDFYQETGK